MDTVQEMVRQPEKDIKVRKHVQELQDRALKVVRCHYTEDYQREDLKTETAKNRSCKYLCIGKLQNGMVVVSVDTLIERGIVKNPRDGVKILGNGELTKKLTVQANAFSASAKEKIEALGGKAEVI